MPVPVGHISRIGWRSLASRPLLRRPSLASAAARPVIALALTLALAAPLAAQTTGPVPGTANREPPAATDAAPRPKPPRDKRAQLDALFEALRLAPDDASATALSDRLDALLSETSSTAGDLLVARANAAAEAKQYDLSLALLDEVVEIEPDSLAGFSRRATVLYLQDDYAGALADIREVLAREPRHFTMLMGLAMILRELGDDARALEAARRALAVNPHLAPAKELESQLATKVDGRGI
ncbi:tetratricopeptide repeat protein [Azorhizobium doebereinerae]|uniref:tetratricopeptide repeat protein n=1 Tax=Azorhizobium doebereinerae TaxID=281091 RepID=UPI0004237C99|nr:hypothetical protein [Azorhizobium doebereinerae]